MLNDSGPVVAVVVAAGSGSRLGAPVPKALVDLDGVPLVRRSVDALVAGGVTQVVVTIPDGLAAEFASALDGVAVPVRCIVGRDPAGFRPHRAGRARRARRCRRARA